MSLLFFSYSHKDEGLRDQIEVHLAMLKRQGLIDTFHDRRITAGEDLNTSIDQSLEKADVILCLLSPDFIASEYCYSKEMTLALERHARNEARVIPVILRHCEWEQTPLGNLRGTPKDNKPIMAWPDKDEAFKYVVLDVRAALAALGKESHERAALAPPSSRIATEAVPPKRSANLHVKKNFTDLERDQFLDEGFEFIAEYFANTLRELKLRNKSVEGKVSRLDAHRLTAALYRDGKKQSGITIFRGGMSGFGRDISFNNSDSGESNSSNGGFSLREHDGAIGFSEMFGFGSSRDRLLTAEDIAEGLWSRFIEPLQR